MQGSAFLAQVILDGEEVVCSKTLEAAMLTAAMCNRVECMPALLAAEGQSTPAFDEKEAVGMTPLMVAAAFGSTEVGHMLHASSATLRDGHAFSPLIVKSETAPLCACTMRAQHGNAHFSIQCLRLGLVQALRALLEAGANLNARSHPEGMKALHFAAYFGYQKIAGVLVEHGASTAIRDKIGKTAAELASLHGHDMLAAALPQASLAEVSASRTLVCRHYVAEPGFAPGLPLG